MTTKQRKSALEATISNICGFPVEIIIRHRGFTLSADGDVTKAIEKAKAFLGLSGKVTNWETDYDEECDMTCAYFNLSAA